MKTVRYFSLCLIGALLTLMHTVCTEEKILEPVGNKQLGASIGSLNFAATGETKTFVVTSTSSWTVSGYQAVSEWLSVSPASGSGNATVTVTTKANTATSERNADLTLSAEGLPSVKVSITQQAASSTVTSVMESVSLNGAALDAKGDPLSGVNVISGTERTTTATDGSFSLSKVEIVNNRMVVKFEKSGFFGVIRSCVKEDDEMYIVAMLAPTGNSDISVQTQFAASQGAALSIGDMKVVIEANGIANANGSDYSGSVRADMLYLDPTGDDFNDMVSGGDLLGLNAKGSLTLRSSYGAIKIYLTDNSGKALQLKSGKPAQVTFPIPAGFAYKPATIPLWSFDETKGIWVEEGVATLQGNVYTGYVTHFSEDDLAPLVLPDDLAPLIIGVKVVARVVDCHGEPLSEAKVEIVGGDVNKVRTKITGYTNANGEFSTKLRQPKGYGYYTAYVTADEESKWVSFNTDGTPDGGTEYVVIGMPCKEGAGGLKSKRSYELTKATLPYSISPIQELVIHSDDEFTKRGNTLLIQYFGAPRDLSSGTFSPLFATFEVNGVLECLFDSEAAPIVVNIVKSGSNYTITITGSMRYMEDIQLGLDIVYPSSATYTGKVKIW